MQTAATAPAAPLETVEVTAQKPAHSHFWEGASLSFDDVLDAINPLQHLPVIGMIYRKLTGDTEGNVARVVGDGIYGGPLGVASGLLDVAVTEITGKDIGENLLALVGLGDEPKGQPATPQVAQPAPAQPAPAAPDKPEALPALAAVTAPRTLPDPAQPVDLPYFPAASPPAASGTAPTKPLAAPSHGIPIDTSASGIMALRAASAAHNPQPVPLALPAGVQLASQSQPSPPPPATDFAQRMKEGLDKYSKLLAERGQTMAQPAAAVDQVH